MPISLLLTLETVKFFQAVILSNDDDYKTPIRDSDGKETGQYIGCSVQASSLNEELGQVNHVFSDKTGTLTMNKMVFHSLLLGRQKYGDIEDKEGTDPVPDIALVDALNSAEAGSETARLAMECLLLCHDAMFDHNSELVSSSPEEIAFLDFVQRYGFVYRQPSISKSQVTLNVDVRGESQSYPSLAKFEFTSDRKRMSVAVQKDNKVYLFTKGADDVVKEFLKDKNTAELKDIDKSIEDAAKKGLRTMMLAYKTIDLDAWGRFEEKYKKAKSSDNFKEELPRLQAEMEKGLTLIGAVALEDKLQDKVPECISFIRQAGLKFWVITGDKTETAISVSRSAAIVSEDMELLKFTEPSDISESEYVKINLRLNSLGDKKVGSVVSGAYLTAIHDMKSTNVILFKEFLELLMRTDVAVFSRISPRQKQEVVKMVRDYDQKLVTLAIGDGANDVNMINAAHVGIGIKGVEGHQAARASDYNFGEFQHLLPLMFHFGRESYRRNANLILYNFYKNILLVTPQFWFGFFNFFSGQSPFEPITAQLFNVFFAFVPIFLYGIFDSSFDRETFLSRPQLYKTGLDDVYFNNAKFIKNFLMTFAIAFYLVYAGLVAFDWNRSHDGHSYGMWNFGNMVYMAVIVVVNAKILTISNSYSILLLMSIAVSIGGYFFIWSLLSNNPNNVLFNTFDEIIYQKHLYIFLIFVFCVCMFEYLVAKMEYHVTLAPYEQEKAKDGLRRPSRKGYKLKKSPLNQTANLPSTSKELKMEMIEESNESSFTDFAGKQR